MKSKNLGKILLASSFLLYSFAIPSQSRGNIPYKDRFSRLESEYLEKQSPNYRLKKLSSLLNTPLNIFIDAPEIPEKIRNPTKIESKPKNNSNEL